MTSVRSAIDTLHCLDYGLAMITHIVTGGVHWTMNWTDWVLAARLRILRIRVIIVGLLLATHIVCGSLVHFVSGNLRSGLLLIIGCDLLLG